MSKYWALQKFIYFLRPWRRLRCLPSCLFLYFWWSARFTVFITWLTDPYCVWSTTNTLFALTVPRLSSSVQHARLVFMLPFYLRSRDEKILNECFDAAFNPLQPGYWDTFWTPLHCERFGSAELRPPASQRGKCEKWMNEMHSWREKKKPY